MLVPPSIERPGRPKGIGGGTAVSRAKAGRGGDALVVVLGAAELLLLAGLGLAVGIAGAVGAAALAL